MEVDQDCPPRVLYDLDAFSKVSLQKRLTNRIDQQTQNPCKEDRDIPMYVVHLPTNSKVEPSFEQVAALMGRLVIEGTYHSVGQSVFDTRTIPGVPIFTYATFLFEAFRCSLSAALYTIAYLERLVHEQNEVQITSYTVHRLLLSAFVVANKFVEDDKFSMQAFAHVGGVDIKDLTRLESSFLKQIRYRLYVSQEAFETYKLLALVLG